MLAAFMTFSAGPSRFGEVRKVLERCRSPARPRWLTPPRRLTGHRRLPTSFQVDHHRDGNSHRRAVPPADGIVNTPGNLPARNSSRTRSTLTPHRLASWPSVKAARDDFGRGMYPLRSAWPRGVRRIDAREAAEYAFNPQIHSCIL